jgi:hypothetical protein
MLLNSHINGYGGGGPVAIEMRRTSDNPSGRDRVGMWFGLVTWRIRAILRVVGVQRAVVGSKQKCGPRSSLRSFTEYSSVTGNSYQIDAVFPAMYY